MRLEVAEMSRVEYVLIGTDEPFDEVSARIAELLAVDPDRWSGDQDFPLQGGGWASLDSELFDPWTDERLQGYRWQLVIGGLTLEGVDVQEAAARRVYDLLVAGTPWALALTYDHTDALVAARSARPSQAARNA